MSAHGKDAVISEDTKVKVGFAATVLGVIVSCVISISASDARVNSKLESQERNLEVRREDHNHLATEVRQINERTARIEGMLEQLQRQIK